MSKKTIIVDLDGTICDIDHRLHYILDEQQNWDKFFLSCGDDKPIWPVIEAVKALHRGTFNIVIFSGRGDIAEDATRNWLARYGIVYTELYLRKADDFRPDHEIKREWLKELGEENVLFSIEDRQSVVDMWREEGVTCFQCAPGDF